MAEDEINIEDEAIALDDVQETSVSDVGVSSLTDYVMEKFESQKTIDMKTNKDGFVLIETIEVYMVLTFSLLKQKNQEYLSK